MAAIVIGAPRSYTDRGWPTVSAPIDIGGRRLELYYRASQGPLATGAGPFALNALAPAMKLGVPLHIESVVSEQLPALASHIQDLLPDAHPYLHRVAVEATVGPATPVRGERGVALFFSGGVDSFYSLLKHNEEITTLIFVHGFDTLLSSPALRARNVRAMRSAATEMGKHVIEVETNFRSTLDAYEPWSHDTATIAQLSIALLLVQQFKKVYIAANYDYGDAWQLFGADGVSVVMDGTDCLRVVKTAFISSSQTAMRWLRVCWQNQAHAFNCCRCEKCLRTMVALHIAGALPHCRTFTQPIDVERVRYMDLGESAYFWPEILAALEQQGTESALTEAIQESLRWASMPDSVWHSVLATMEQRGDQPATTRTIRELLSQTQRVSAGEREQMQQLRKATTRALELERELRIIKTSQSWKLTAPLRNAGLSLRRLRSGIR